MVRNVSTKFVVQMKYMKYSSGVFCFQSIRIVLPLFVSDVTYAGSPHFKVSSILPTPGVDAAVFKISCRRTIISRRISTGYDSNTLATAWGWEGFTEQERRKVAL